MSYEFALDAVDEIRQRWRAEGARLRWIGDVAPRAMQQEGYGFDWWPGDFKVSLRASGPRPDDANRDDPTFRLSLKTELLDGLNIYLPSTPFWLSEINGRLPNRALTVPSPEIVAEAGMTEREFPAEFNIVAYVNAGNRDRMLDLFIGMGLLLPVEAQYMVDHHADRTEAAPARSSPPGDADASMGRAPFEEIQSRYLAAGKTMNADRVEREFAAVMADWGDTEWTRGKRRGDALVLDSSFGDQSAAGIVLDREYRHEALGLGLMAMLILPSRGRVDEVAAQANLLNVMEAGMWSDKRMPLFGAWTALREEGLSALLGHQSFVPALLDREGLDGEMVDWMLRRAEWFKSMYLPETRTRPIAEILDQ